MYDFAEREDEVESELPVEVGGVAQEVNVAAKPPQLGRESSRDLVVERGLIWV